MTDIYDNVKEAVDNAILESLNGCQVCGALDVHVRQHGWELQIPFSSIKRVWVAVSVCGTCGQFVNTNLNDPIIEAAVKKAKAESVGHLIKAIEEGKITFIYIERVLDLPINTIHQWKENPSKVTDAELALLRMIVTVPGILELADNNWRLNGQKT